MLYERVCMLTRGLSAASALQAGQVESAVQPIHLADRASRAAAGVLSGLRYVFCHASAVLARKRSADAAVQVLIRREMRRCSTRGCSGRRPA